MKLGDQFFQQLIGKEVLIRVPVQYGKLSKEPRICKIISISKENENKFWVTFRICKGEKGAGRKFGLYVVSNALERLLNGGV